MATWSPAVADTVWTQFLDRQELAVATDRLELQEEGVERRTPQPPGSELQNELDEVWAALAVDYGRHCGCWPVPADATVTTVDRERMVALVQLQSSLRLRRWREDRVWQPDWTLASVFLLCAGHRERCRKLLSAAAAATAAGGASGGSALLILTPLSASDKLTWTSMRSWQVYVRYGVVMDWVQRLCEQELPALSRALQHASIPINRLALPWLEQCFWNALCWQDIACMLLATLAWTAMAPVLVAVALLRHFQARILETVASGNFIAVRG